MSTLLLVFCSLHSELGTKTSLLHIWLACSVNFCPWVFAALPSSGQTDDLVYMHLLCVCVSLAWLPAPALFGLAIDSSCIQWRYVCGKKSGCGYYDNNILRNRWRRRRCCWWFSRMFHWSTLSLTATDRYLGLQVGYKVMGIFLLMMLGWKVKRTQEYSLEKRPEGLLWPGGHSRNYNTVLLLPLLLIFIFSPPLLYCPPPSPPLLLLPTLTNTDLPLRRTSSFLGASLDSFSTKEYLGSYKLFLSFLFWDDVNNQINLLYKWDWKLPNGDEFKRREGTCKVPTSCGNMFQLLVISLIFKLFFKWIFVSDSETHIRTHITLSVVTVLNDCGFFFYLDFF